MHIEIRLLAVVSGILFVLGLNEILIRKNYLGAYLLWIVGLILLMVSVFLDPTNFIFKVEL